MLKKIAALCVALLFLYGFYAQASGQLEMESHRLVGLKTKAFVDPLKIEKLEKYLENCRKHDAHRIVRRSQPDYQTIGDCCWRAHHFREDYKTDVLLETMKDAGYQESTAYSCFSCLTVEICPYLSQCLYDHKIGNAQRHLSIVKAQQMDRQPLPHEDEGNF